MAGRLRLWSGYVLFLYVVTHLLNHALEVSGARTKKEAVTLALADRQQRQERLGELRDQLWRRLEAIGGIHRNGAASPRLAHNLNVWVDGVDGAAIHSRLRRRLAVSSGSACSAGEPSHVLQALGLSRQQAAASIRFGLGADTTAEEIAQAADLLEESVKELRQGPTR